MVFFPDQTVYKLCQYLLEYKVSLFHVNVFLIGLENLEAIYLLHNMHSHLFDPIHEPSIIVFCYPKCLFSFLSYQASSSFSHEESKAPQRTFRKSADDASPHGRSLVCCFWHYYSTSVICIHL